MKIIDRLLQWVVVFFGIQTEDTTEPAPAEPAPADISWLVPEQDFKSILDAIQSDGLVQMMTMASSYGLYAVSNPPEGISFSWQQLELHPQQCAEVDGFGVWYASCNGALGVVICPKGASFRRGVFYYVMTSNEIFRAIRMPDVSECWNDDFRTVAEERINAALSHYARVWQYAELLNERGFIGCIRIGQPGSSPVVRFSRDADVIGPDVKVSEEYGDLVSAGPWALQSIPKLGLCLYIAGFDHDYRDEIRDTLAARRAA